MPFTLMTQSWLALTDAILRTHFNFLEKDMPSGEGHMLATETIKSKQTILISTVWRVQLMFGFCSLRYHTVIQILSDQRQSIYAKCSMPVVVLIDLQDLVANSRWY